jgi:hypothetical protein
MPGWTNDELDTIVTADELQIASRRPDATLRAPVTIWVVRLGDDVYVRSVNGRGASWFRGAQDRHEAHVRSESVERDVRLIETEELAEAIDDAYRRKYHRYATSIVDRITTAEARAATLELVPHTLS